MGLLLKVISYQGNPPVQPLSASFDEKGGTIGRKQGNDWVLKDPQHYISGRHAQITYTFPDYSIVDTSSNGVYINNEEQPLGKGNSAPLADGDVIGIGDYDILVSLDSASSVLEGGISNHAENAPDLGDANPSLFAEIGKNPVDEFIPDNAVPDEDWINIDSDPIMRQDRDRDLSENHFPNSQKNHTSPLNESAQVILPIEEHKEEKTPRTVEDLFPENWLESGSSDTIESCIQPTPDTSPHKPKTEARARGSTQTQTPTSPSSKGLPKEAEYLNAAHKFISGAGLDDDAVAACSFAPETFFIIGKLLRMTVKGTRDVLLARSRIKSEMRLDVTTIQAGKNNPIKFSFNVDEALSRLLTPPESGYMNPVEAIEESFEDILAHQMAVLAGMQTALQSILKRFDPRMLEKRLEKTSPLSASIPIHRQAKLWGLFEELYEEIRDEAEDDFNQLFGRAFSRAYNEQVKKIKLRRMQDRSD